MVSKYRYKVIKKWTIQGWINELDDFYKHLKSFHERELNKDKIVKEFLIFMKIKYGYQEELLY